MAGDLSSLATLVGGAVSNTFGNWGALAMALLLFTAVAVAMRAGFEIAVIYFFALFIILANMGLLPSWLLGIVFVIGSILILLAFTRIFKI